MSKTPKNRSRAPKGSGGKHRRALSGRGPTPKAENRPYHPAYARKKAAEQRAAHRAAQERGRQRTAVQVEGSNELVVGRNPVKEAAASGLRIKTVFVAADPAYGSMRDVIDSLAGTGADYKEVTKRDLDRASDGAAHQGVAVEVEEYDYWDLEDLILRAIEKVEPGLIVALDHVTDPHNVGAVLRSAGAFGADGLLIPTRRQAGVGTTAWKVSAGAAAHVPTARVPNLVQALRVLKERGFFVVGLDGRADVELRGLPLATEPLVIVTGAEGKGLSRLARETCDQVVSIPMNRRVESLNAAVATGIVLYEVDSVRATQT